MQFSRTIGNSTSRRYLRSQPRVTAQCQNPGVHPGCVPQDWVHVSSPALFPLLYLRGGEQGAWAPSWGVHHHASCYGQLCCTPAPKAQSAEEQELSKASTPTPKVRSPNFFPGHAGSQLTPSSWRSVSCERSYPAPSEEVVDGNGAETKCLTFPVSIFLSLAAISLNAKESLCYPSS